MTMQNKTMLEEFWSYATGRDITLKDYSYAVRFTVSAEKAPCPGPAKGIKKLPAAAMMEGQDVYPL